MEIEDSLLASAAASGDKQAFVTLYDRYVAKIYRFIYFRLAHKETAEDITSQTFLKALEHISSFNPKKGSFSTWLYRIARNAVIDNRRAQKPSIPLDFELNIAGPETPDADRKLAIDQIRAYLPKLSSTEQEIIMMRVWQELSYKEIANILDQSEASCKMAYLRGVKKLQSMMAPHLFVFLLMYLIK